LQSSGIKSANLSAEINLLKRDEDAGGLPKLNWLPLKKQASLARQRYFEKVLL